jgi:hypothetical protein
LRHWATNWKIACLIFDGVTGIFHWHNPSCRTMALGLTQPLIWMSKGKAMPLQTWTDPEGSRRQISRHSAHEGGKFVSPTHRPPLPPENIPGTHFC